MKKNKTTNDKANTIINVINIMNELKENNEIQFVNYRWDEENNTFDVHFIPKQTIKHINVDFTLTPTGSTFK